MIAATHLITGATLGAFAPNWWSAAILAILLHFLLDTIPHSDFGEQHTLKITAPVVADVVIGTILVGLFYLYGPRQANLLWGAFFGILPDIIQIGLMVINPENWRKYKYTKFHEWLHWFDYSKKFKLKNPPSVGFSVAYQVVIWLICIAILVLIRAV